MEQISVSGTSFLERILRTKKSSMPRCCFVSPHNSLFSLVLIFPSFWAKSLRSQTLVIGGSVWNKKCKCRRNAHAFERSGQSFGFPQIVRAHEKLVLSPHLASNNVSCGNQLRLLPSSKAWTFHLNTYKSNNFPSSYWPSKSVFDNWILTTGYTPAFVHGYPKYKTRTIQGIFFLSTVIPYLKAYLFYEKG